MHYLINNFAEVSRLFLQHLFLVSLSLYIGILIALPVGYILSKTKFLSGLIIYILGIIYTIPSLALFAILIPFVGLGLKPALIALVLYSQLILIRNIVLGFQSVDSAIIEAGRGMGLNNFQLFLKVEFPLASPKIISGLRIAVISSVGIATIAAFINAGGLGVLIFDGLYQNYIPKIVLGTILISGLAVFLDRYLQKLEKESLKFVED